MPDLAARLADYACSLRFADLPPETVHEAKRRVIDSLGVAVGALDADAAVVARRCAARFGGQPAVPHLGGGTSTLEWATFVNGLLIRYLDYNDTYLSLEPAHPSDNLAAVLAVGALTGADGRALLTALVIAYEIHCRLCDAASLRAHGVDHVTYVALSACAAACRLLGLNAARTRHALGIAAVSNVALRQTRAGELSMWKGCAAANAARNGVFAALLAGEGLTGPAPAFTGELGFERLVTRGPIALPAFGGAGAPFLIHHTSIKCWPAEYHAQSAIDAALELRRAIGNVGAIEAVDVYTFDAAYDIIGRYAEAWAPRTRETADHSLPYCTAVALLDGAVTLGQFAPERFTAADVVALTSKVRVHRDAELTRRYPAGIPNRVVVTLRDGSRHVREVEHPCGHAGNPMSDAEVEAKFRRLVEPRLGSAKADALLGACRTLETLPHAAELVQLVG
ncbi:MAG: MmgE/PrpD family protein [Gemmataceae bacterium]